LKPVTPNSTPTLQIDYHGFYNLSNHSFSQNEIDALSKGIKFIPRPPNLSSIELEESINTFNRNIRLKYHFSDQSNQRPILRVRNKAYTPPLAGKLVEQYLLEAASKLRMSFEDAYNGLGRKRQNEGKVFTSTLKKLADVPNLIFRLADKNLGLVALTKEHYESIAIKQLTFSPGATTYTQLERKPAAADIWKSLKDILRKYNIYDNNNNTITAFAKLLLKDEKEEIVLCKFYLMLKIHKHKSDPPGRPILANINTTTFSASKWLDSILQPLRKLGKSYLSDSQQLLLTLETTTFPDGVILLSADVESLYPSIDINDGLEILNYQLHMNQTKLNFTLENICLIMDIASWVLNNTYFEFGNTTWKQIKGTAMGTPFAVVFACIYLDHLEELVLNKIKLSTNNNPSSKPIILRRFIDDIFGIFYNQTAANIYIDTFNTIRQSIKLTHQTGNSVNFLDLNIYLGKRYFGENLLDITIYQKPLNKYLYLHPASFHKRQLYRAFITAEIKRYRLICTDTGEFLKVKQLFYDRLIARDYTRTFLKPIFKIIFIRATLIKKISSFSDEVVETKNVQIGFVSRYNPLSHLMDIKSCLKYPKYLQRDMNWNATFSVNDPLVIYSRSKNMKDILIHSKYKANIIIKNNFKS
jgi:hypothetical protein